MKTYNQNASAARFLLGGIGTGNISLDQNARLCDFELWNLPNKGFRSPYTFFAVRTATACGDVRVKALESQLAPPYTNSHGANAWDIGGLPRFRNSQMQGNYPFVNFTLTDSYMPIEAKLEAFTPLIPLETDDSSLPVASLKYTIKNISDKPLTVSVAGSMSNLCDLKGHDIWTNPFYEHASVNKYVEEGNLRGIHFLTGGNTEKDLDYFEMAMLTPETQNVTHIDLWSTAAWWDGHQDFWNDFMEDGELTPGRNVDGRGNTMHTTKIPVASVCVKKEIAPGQEAEFEFILSWYRPNRAFTWHQHLPVDCSSDECCCKPARSATIRNYYAKFGPPLKTAKYFLDNKPRLEADSRLFANALMTGTLPHYALEAVSANITVIRSTTCFRVEDGTFFGFEGCFNTQGCCDGNCSHVWNYTQTMAYLFPDLERSMRETEFLTETEDDGKMHFRAMQYLNDRKHGYSAATDGQLGTIIRLYRDWKLCGDDAFIKKLWPQAKLALEYAFTHWDMDGDGVMEGEQHNTYDIEFYGASSMLNSIYYAALRAGEEIANYLNDTASAQKYSEIWQKGAKKLDELTFNGEFYVQNIEDVNEYKYQYGKGCLADQLFGQQLAHACGLGYVLNEKNVKSAVHSIFRHNFREGFHDFANVQRTYALGDESGLLLCSWPNGGRPQIPFVYSDEVWTGIEYQVASHLIYEGFVAEGLKIVEACRNRHDGVRRSPWNEVECGNHYARSLASYGVLLALTGFNCDAVGKKLTFSPANKTGDFSAFFCCPAGWGIFHRENGVCRIETLYGDLSEYEICTK